jgi:hypothetical protein
MEDPSLQYAGCRSLFRTAMVCAVFILLTTFTALISVAQTAPKFLCSTDYQGGKVHGVFGESHNWKAQAYGTKSAVGALGA